MSAPTRMTDKLTTEVKSRIIPIVTSCFGQLTAEQWRLLRRCKPDATTKLLLADLILEMVTIVSKAFSPAALSNEDVSVEEGETSLGETSLGGTSLGELIEDCLKTALDITDVQCENSRRLRELIDVQIILNINSENVYMHITMPKILDAILDSMVKMTVRVKKIFKCQRQTASSTADTSAQHPGPVEEPHTSNDNLETEVPAETPEVPAETPVVSSDNEGIKTSNKIIQDELNGMIGPLVDEMSEVQFDSFQSDSCLEETLVKDIVEELQEDIHPKRGTLKNLFTLQFTKMWLNRIWMQLTKKYQNNLTESTITLDEIPDLILTNLTKEEKKQMNSRSLLLKPMPRAGALILTKRLTNFLFKRMMGKDISVSPTGSTGSALQSDVDIYEEIWDKVWNFQGLMEWWENTQLEIITERLRHALKKPEQTAPEGIFRRAIKCTRAFFTRCAAQVRKSFHAEVQQFLNGYIVPEETPPAVNESQVVEKHDSYIAPEETPVDQNLRQHFLETISEKLVTEVLLKSQIKETAVVPSDMIQNLFEMIWPEIKDLDFEVTLKTVKMLEKNLLRDLSKTMGGVEMICINLSSKQKDDALGKLFARSFEKLLFPPKRNCFDVPKFFSSAGEGICNIYKKKNQVNPLDCPHI